MQMNGLARQPTDRFANYPLLYGGEKEWTGAPELEGTACSIIPNRRTTDDPFVATYVIGTGGSLTNALIQSRPVENSPCSIYVYRLKEQSLELEIPDLPSYIGAVRRHLSLNMTDLARVLRVERPTVYSWLSGGSEPRKVNRDRLEELYRLARHWRKTSSVPVGRHLQAKLDNGRSLLDCLSDRQLNAQAIREIFSMLKPKVVAEGDRRKAKSISEIARRHRFPEMPEREQERSLDRETKL